jgi:uncharacterized alkaline shock family protein YloU
MAQNSPLRSDDTQSASPTPRSGNTTQRLDNDSSQGKTTISSSVVQKIAGMAAREISGVYSLGGGISKAFGALRERIPGSNPAVSTSGVEVEVGEKQAAVDLDIVVEYGAGIVDLAKAIRRNVITAVERMTGLEVTEVNIAVNDIHLPEDDEQETPSESQISRVE